VNSGGRLLYYALTRRHTGAAIASGFPAASKECGEFTGIWRLGRHRKPSIPSLEKDSLSKLTQPESRRPAERTHT